MNPTLQFLALPRQRRALAFEQAATQRSIDPVIMEKDFWVCWLLGLLFGRPELAPHLVFKGGTSLSKVFGAINRFSEDVDLSVSPSFVGADPQALEGETSRTQRDKIMGEMQHLCCLKTKETIAPLLESVIREALGAPAHSAGWLNYALDPHAHSPILFFSYPAATATSLNYVQRVVKLELGSLSDQKPVGRHPIRPWVAEVFPSVFTDWRCEVTALELSRSFWEKATILHAEFHRPENQPMPDRYARHYADFVRLLDHPEASGYLSDRVLAQRVVEWKSRFFARGWAHYELARHGSFRLTPPAGRQAALAKDYAVMRPMFLSEPPPFEQLMARLDSAEKRINAG